MTSQPPMLTPRRPLNHHPAIVAFSLLFCFPAGLVFMWSGQVWTRKTRWIITGVFALLVVANALRVAATAATASAASAGAAPLVAAATPRKTVAFPAPWLTVMAEVVARPSSHHAHRDASAVGHKFWSYGTDDAGGADTWTALRVWGETGTAWVTSAQVQGACLSPDDLHARILADDRAPRGTSYWAQFNDGPLSGCVLRLVPGPGVCNYMVASPDGLISHDTDRPPRDVLRAAHRDGAACGPAGDEAAR